MKRNTLIKLLIVCMFCLLVIPMIASCGTKYTITFDPNGGTLDEADITLEMGEDEELPRLPKPKRNTKIYKFLGWFEDGDEDEEVEEGDRVRGDMELVALWEIKVPTVTVEFNPGEGALESEETFVEVPQGERLSEVLKGLPKASLDGYKLEGWYLPDGTTKIGLTTIFDADTILVAKWDQIILCKDGTENHNYNAWVDKTLKATCTEPKIRSHVCSLCGYEEEDEVEPAKGHQYGDWVNGQMERTHVCGVCDKSESQKFVNVTKNEGFFEKIELVSGEGSMWAMPAISTLVDGTFEVYATQGGGCSPKSSEVRIELTLKEAQWVDVVCITSNSYNPTGATFQIMLTYEADADGNVKESDPVLRESSFGKDMLPDGSFTYKTSQFDVSARIKKVTLIVPMGNDGQDFIGEIALGCVPSSDNK